MGCYDFEQMRSHIGHNIVCVAYGGEGTLVNVAIECETCNLVLVDLHRFEYLEKINDENDSPCCICQEPTTIPDEDGNGGEGEICQKCDRWICNNCLNPAQSATEAILCKQCAKEKSRE
jgi:hypothetical protein